MIFRLKKNKMFYVLFICRIKKKITSKSKKLNSETNKNINNLTKVWVYFQRNKHIHRF
jgi:hypothetical protein